MAIIEKAPSTDRAAHGVPQAMRVFLTYVHNNSQATLHMEECAHALPRAHDLLCGIPQTLEAVKKARLRGCLVSNIAIISHRLLLQACRECVHLMQWRQHECGCPLCTRSQCCYHATI